MTEALETVPQGEKNWSNLKAKRTHPKLIHNKEK
jgi:hypothetical protein